MSEVPIELNYSEDWGLNFNILDSEKSYVMIDTNSGVKGGIAVLYVSANFTPEDYNDYYYDFNNDV